MDPEKQLAGAGKNLMPTGPRTGNPAPAVADVLRQRFIEGAAVPFFLPLQMLQNATTAAQQQGQEPKLVVPEGGCNRVVTARKVNLS